MSEHAPKNDVPPGFVDGDPVLDEILADFPENDALAPVAALADRWADVLAECKAADPRWILDRSVTTLETALTELRRAINEGRVIPPGKDAS